MKKNLFLTIAFLFFLFSFSGFGKTSLSLKRSTMQLGGSCRMPINIPKDGETYVGLEISPQWDYFISRSFSVGLSPSIAKDSLTSDRPWWFSVAARATYYLDLGGPIYPYVGAGVGVKWRTKIKSVRIPVIIPVGILVALNNRVAIDLGIPAEFTFNSEGYLGAQLPIGYIGVRAFF